MKVTEAKHPSGVVFYTIGKDENVFTLSPFGGQIIGWKKKGIDIIFANEEGAIIDGKTPYRGGIPICFPYFGKGLLLPNKTSIEPQHGLARKSVWKTAINENTNQISFSITQPSPTGYPGTTFALTITYDFNIDLSIKAMIVNEGENPSPFQLAFHSYWHAPSPADTFVIGLGTDYLDNLDLLAAKVDLLEDPRKVPPPYDRIYPHCAEQLKVQTQLYTTTVTTHGCHGAVLWNPGQNHGLKDLKTPTFVCVESGAIIPSPVLQPKATHELSIAYRVAV